MQVARDTALTFIGEGEAEIHAERADIMTYGQKLSSMISLNFSKQMSALRSKYNVNYFKQFRLVLNALDNRKARSHVNRMCLAADVPLVESGTAGYLGQVLIT